jgi:hypothetical protein
MPSFTVLIALSLSLPVTGSRSSPVISSKGANSYPAAISAANGAAFPDFSYPLRDGYKPI